MRLFLILLIACISTSTLSYTYNPFNVIRGLFSLNGYSNNLTLNSSTIADIFLEGDSYMVDGDENNDGESTLRYYGYSNDENVDCDIKNLRDENKDNENGHVNTTSSTTWNNNDSEQSSQQSKHSTSSLEQHQHHHTQQAQAENDLISEHEVINAHSDIKSYINKNREDIVKAGWKLVHENDIYTLFKRRADNGQGPVEYMMKGVVQDVSPRVFLHSQVNRALRKSWDSSMKEMESNSNENDPKSLDNFIMQGSGTSEDSIYYRTKWPWPLKDRDYTLARKCQFFPEEDAIVFISKAFNDHNKHPRQDGVIRVDNYWCHSAYFSNNQQQEEEQQQHKSNNQRVGQNTFIKVDETQKNGQSTHQLNDVVIVDTHIEGNGKKQMNLREFMEDGRGKLFDKMKSHITGLPGFSNPFAEAGHKISKSISGDKLSNSLEAPGTSFITIFSDDAKVPLPPKIIDMISTQAEKAVPDSMKSLHEAAKIIQDSK